MTETDEKKTLETLEQEQPKQEIVPVHIMSAWGNEKTPPELRGYATSLSFLTPEQINGEFRFLLNQFFEGVNRLAEANVKKPE